jgi:hypothetical protein
MDDQAASEYLFDIEHFSSSSTEASACSVEPGSAEDVGEIVRRPDLMRQLLPTCIWIATYPGIKPNALCRERWGTLHEPGIFVNPRRTDHNVTFQQDKSQFRVWDS